MNITWLDFSERDRKRTMSVLDMLREPDMVDELGIGVIRNHFANIFFPGTSTIQTRAKYFLLTAYIFKDFEQKINVKNFREFKEILDKEERACAEQLIASSREDDIEKSESIIGERTIKGGNWVVRGPAEIYWNGLREYGIFENNKLSLKNYANALIKAKNERNNMNRLKDLHRNINEDGLDTSLPSNNQFFHLWKVPECYSNWKKNLEKNNSIKLSREEAEFLRNQIIETQGNSLLGIILKYYMEEFANLEVNSNLFQNLGSIILRGKNVPQEIKEDYILAKNAADFMYLAQIRYNVILANDENNRNISEEWKQYINNEWNIQKKQMKNIAQNVDIDRVCMEANKDNIKKFLEDFRDVLLSENGIDEEELDDLIIKRENSKKQKNRLRNTSENVERWHGISKISYRVIDAHRLVKDIFEGLEG